MSLGVDPSTNRTLALLKNNSVPAGTDLRSFPSIFICGVGLKILATAVGPAGKNSPLGP